MKERMLRLLLGAIAIVGTAACLPAQSPPTIGQPTLSPQATPVTREPALRVVPVTPTIKVLEEETVPVPTIPDPSHSSPEGLVAEAIDDLAQRLNVAAEAIEVVRVEEVTWRDGSLGCPQPGMAYTQALVNGMRMELRAGGQIYHYHSGGGRPPFLCKNPQDPFVPDQGDDT